MEIADTERFYRAMSDYHKDRADKDRGEARMLWDICLDLFKAVRECEGAEDLEHLKERVASEAIKLGDYLQHQGARAA